MSVCFRAVESKCGPLCEFNFQGVSNIDLIQFCHLQVRKFYVLVGDDKPVFVDFARCQRFSVKLICDARLASVFLENGSYFHSVDTLMPN